MPAILLSNVSLFTEICIKNVRSQNHFWWISYYWLLAYELILTRYKSYNSFILINKYSSALQYSAAKCSKSILKRSALTMFKYASCLTWCFLCLIMTHASIRTLSADQDDVWRLLSSNVCRPLDTTEPSRPGCCWGWLTTDLHRQR